MKNMQNVLKKFMVYIDDGKEVFKIAVPSKDESGARSYVAGNGEVIAVKDVTEQYPISLNKVFDALEKANFSDIEIDLIQRTLNFTNIAE